MHFHPDPFLSGKVPFLQAFPLKIPWKAKSHLLEVKRGKGRRKERNRKKSGSETREGEREREEKREKGVV